MQFVIAIRKGFLNYANFRTRSSRSSYWFWVLFTLIVDLLIGGNDALSLAVTAALLLPSIAVAIRRMHDINRSGWWTLVPFYNVFLACQPSYEGVNNWGPPEPPAFTG